MRHYSQSLDKRTTNKAVSGRTVNLLVIVFPDPLLSVVLKGRMML